MLKFFSNFLMAVVKWLILFPTHIQHYLFLDLLLSLRVVPKQGGIPCLQSVQATI
jgi:hypothetical protein